jgi:hypothetical protein
LEHISLDNGEDAVAMSLSAVASVQCCMVISGSGEPPRTSFISQRPALRSGNSAACASSAGLSTMSQAPNHNETSCRDMLHAPESKGIDQAQ